MASLIAYGELTVVVLIAEKIAEDDWRWTGPDLGLVRGDDKDVFIAVTNLIGTRRIVSVQIDDFHNGVSVMGFQIYGSSVQPPQEWLLDRITATDWGYTAL